MKIEFDSVEDLTANLVKKGHSEEDAEKIAKSMFGEDAKDKEEKGNTEPSELAKSVSEGNTGIQKILEKLGLNKPSGKDDEGEDDLNKSIFDDVNVGADGGFDASETLISFDKSYQEANENFNAFTKSFAESLIARGEIDTAFAKSIDAIMERLTTMEKSLTVTDGVNTVPLGEAIEALARQTAGKLILKSSDSPGGDKDENNTGGEDSMTFGELNKSLDAAVESKTITNNEATRAIAAFKTKEKAVLDDILAKIKVKS